MKGLSKPAEARGAQPPMQDVGIRTTGQGPLYGGHLDMQKMRRLSLEPNINE